MATSKSSLVFNRPTTCCITQVLPVCLGPHILRKLHLANRTQAALYALRAGLTTLDEGA